MKVRPCSCQRTSLLTLWISSHLLKNFILEISHTSLSISYISINFFRSVGSFSSAHKDTIGSFILQKFSSPLALFPGVSFRKLTERVVYICFSYFTSHFLNTLKLPKTAFDQVITGLYLAKLMVAALSTFFAISSSSLLAKDSYFYPWLWLQVWIFN